MSNFKKTFLNRTSATETYADHMELRRLLAASRKADKRAGASAKGTIGLVAVSAVLLALGYASAAGAAVIAGVGAGVITIKNKLQSMVMKDSAEKKKAVLFNSPSRPTPTHTGRKQNEQNR